MATNRKLILLFSRTLVLARSISAVIISLSVIKVVDIESRQE